MYGYEQILPQSFFEYFGLKRNHLFTNGMNGKVAVKDLILGF